MSNQDDLLDYVERLSEADPEGLLVLLIAVANELGGAVEDGRASAALLSHARDHLQMLLDQRPGQARQ